jgi:two-component system, response regulator YesN
MSKTSTFPLIQTVVVDDDASITKLLSKILETKFGNVLSVTAVTDAKQVLGMAKANRVDLCITDLDMPSVNGLKCLQQLKSINPLTQVVILTAHPAENAIRSAFAMGADEYLLKPIDVELFCDVVTFLAERFRRYHSEIIFDKPRLTKVL